MTGTTQTVTRHDRRMYEIMNRGVGAAAYATAARRRLVVGAHMLLTVGAVAAWLAMLVGGALWVAAVLFALLLPWCVLMGVINASTRGLLELRTRLLDERQLAERDRVRAWAQRVMTWLLVAVAAGVGLGVWLADVKAEGLLFPVLFSVLVTHWMMPNWVAALSVRDEPADDPGIE